MAVVVHSEKLSELIDENAEIEQLATGFMFTEGPIWMSDGSLHFSDMPGDKRRRKGCCEHWPNRQLHRARAYSEIAPAMVGALRRHSRTLAHPTMRLGPTAAGYGPTFLYGAIASAIFCF